jgi:Ni,Fe-hydrogenase I small subunit
MRYRSSPHRRFGAAQFDAHFNEVAQRALSASGYSFIMSNKEKIARLCSRILANLIAVVAVTVIFGVKTALDARARPDAAMAQRMAAVTSYEPYFTEQP